jgi:GNAT superfamily N-acetyltransferase
MIRLATETDHAAIAAFLAQRRRTSMSLSGNLRDHGVNGTGHRDATRFFLATQRDEIVAVFGFTEMGFLLCEAPVFDPAWVPQLGALLAGSRIFGLSGEATQVAALRSTLKSALGFEKSDKDFEDTEPLYHLDLGALRLPQGPGVLRTAGMDDLALVVDWRIAFDREVYGVTSQDEEDRSKVRARALVESGRARLLEVKGQPVAMTAFNAVLAQAVQLCSVYTPPPLRGREYGRRVVALQLSQAHTIGVEEAVLFATSPAACRVYESLGFQQIGRFTIIDFEPAKIFGDIS